MSATAIPRDRWADAVFADPAMQGDLLIVAFAFYRHAKRDGTRALVSVPMLQQATGWSYATARRRLGDLRTAGYLHQTAGGAGGPSGKQRAAIYELRLPTAVETALKMPHEMSAVSDETALTEGVDSAQSPVGNERPSVPSKEGTPATEGGAGATSLGPPDGGLERGRLLAAMKREWQNALKTTPESSRGQRLYLLGDQAVRDPSAAALAAAEAGFYFEHRDDYCIHWSQWHPQAVHAFGWSAVLASFRGRDVAPGYGFDECMALVAPETGSPWRWSELARLAASGAPPPPDLHYVDDTDDDTDADGDAA